MGQWHRWCRYFLRHLVDPMLPMDPVVLEVRKDQWGLMRRLIQLDRRVQMDLRDLRVQLAQKLQCLHPKDLTVQGHL